MSNPKDEKALTELSPEELRRGIQDALRGPEPEPQDPKAEKEDAARLGFILRQSAGKINQADRDHLRRMISEGIKAGL
jgi:hypothetical protein